MATPISTLTTPVWTNMSDGQPLPAATLNSGVNNANTAIGNLNAVAAELENQWAAVTASPPTDKPAGKIIYQTDNKLWLGYLTANGTPVPLLAQASATPTYVLPDVAARTINVSGLDVTNSGSALTSTSSATTGAVLTLPANALNATGRAYRATFFIDTNSATINATFQIRFNGTVLWSLTNTSVAAAFNSIVTIVRVSTTQYIVGVVASGMDTSFIGTPQSAGGTSSVGLPGNLQTVTNWTSAINFDVNISAWTSGTIRSMIIGEQLG